MATHRSFYGRSRLAYQFELVEARGYFVRANGLLEDLSRAKAKHRPGRRLRVYLAPRMLIGDEFGVWSCDRPPRRSSR